MDKELIAKRYKEISSRDLKVIPVTMDEVRDVIVPYNRMHREEIFTLNAPKKTKKVKTEKSALPKRTRKAVKKEEPSNKVKKLTNKDLVDLLLKGDTVPDQDPGDLI